MILQYTSRLPDSGTWVDRCVQAHQLLFGFVQSQANQYNRRDTNSWTVEYGGIDGSDAKATPESMVLFTQNEVPSISNPIPNIWDLTALTQQWVDGSANNHGVILWATNENTPGYSFWFPSSEAASDQPVLEIIWSQSSKTVYFFKDHLGTVRATVDESGDVVGYDDYDPWGYLLENRTLATPWSVSLAAAKNKFTGKEWDDEYGVNWYHFGARPYDPEIARWVVVDPLAGKYPDLSPYTYTANNPIKFIDPNGQEIRISGSAQFQQTTLANLQRLTNDKLTIKNSIVRITKLGGQNSSKKLSFGTLLIQRLNRKGSGAKIVRDSRRKSDHCCK